MPSKATPRYRFPFQAARPSEPPPEFARLRQEEPVALVELPTGDRAWLVTGYHEVRQVLSDLRFSRAAAAAPGAPRLRPVPPDLTSILSLDPPRHTRLRSLVAYAFTGRRVAGLRPRIQARTDALLDDLVAQGPPGDLAAGLATPLAMAVICEILGVPEEGREQFRQWTDTVLNLVPAEAGRLVAARSALHEYLGALVADKRRSFQGDLLSVLASDHDGDRLTHEELLTFGATLLTAGYHTVAAAIVNGTLALLLHPQELTRLRAQPPLIATAVEELLRFTPGAVSGGTIRVATEDVELGGVTIRRGEAVIPSTTSANRDGCAFADPDVLAVDRPVERGKPSHLAFGHGVHHCLGASLARLELRVAIGTLVRRLPGLRLAVPARELVWSTNTMIRTLTALPVTWQHGRTEE
ncbi:cytochrome P450 [Nonomuraea sp. NPDC050783]|uniref:cytochrome P450 n=1 Tax=Nonomuraea sp. NPDC050783 TaxID=3154634 RepID=UPI00346678E1